mgnify:CR=1 FL=1
MPKKKQVVGHTFNQNSVLSLVNLFNDYLNDNFFDDTAKDIFTSIPLVKYATESIIPNETSAIHKVLSRLSEWYDLSLGYDRWYKIDIEDVIPYIRQEFTNMGIPIPLEFQTNDSVAIGNAIRRLRPDYIDGLWQKIHASFLNIWNNRELCYSFNLKMSYVVKTLKQTDCPFLEKDGIFPRHQLPIWARYLIIHRDYGNCQYCGTPVATPAKPIQEYHFDHIIPLAQGGTNDISNFLLSCPSCNLSKNADVISLKTIVHWPSISNDFFA